MNEFIGKGEAGVRAMRDLVFRTTINDESWENVKDNWMRPESMIWLMEKIKIDRQMADRWMILI